MHRQGSANPASPSLALRELACSRGGRQLFRELTVELSPSEVIQVEGPNGSGKTTLLRAICGLVPIESGEIMWGDLPIAEADSRFRDAISYIGHTPGVKLDLTPLENLRAAGALDTTTPNEPFDAALRQLGMEGIEDVPLRRLSAGQRRRVALARLLVAPTRLWVLDEPFTGLDAAGKAQVEGLIGKHCTGGGMAVISTHQPLELANQTVHHVRLGD